MSEKLLPCPFCGGEAEIATENLLGDVVCWITCSRPECFMFNGAVWGKATREQAIAAWNARAERECEMVPCDPVNDWPLHEGERAYECSVCGNPHYYTDDDPIHYCAYCGAKVCHG